MSLTIGIVGLPNVGKSTLFNALTRAGAAVAAYPFTTIEPNHGVAVIPDARLDALAALIKPQQTTPAAVEFVDIAGLVRGAHRGEGLGNQFLGHIRAVDALAVVCRCFEDADVAHVEGTVNPLRDLEVLDLELILADLEITERRLEKTRSAAKARPRDYAAELESLESLRASLQAGERAAAWLAAQPQNLPAEMAEWMDASLLTTKRRIYIANVGERDLPDGGAWAREVARAAEAERRLYPGAQAVVICAQLEADLAEWPPDEAAAYRADLGLERSGLESLAWAGYAVLDLITFFTVVGGQEVRAWPLRRGGKAPQAAGKVHSQMERGFIRAEVISCEQLLQAGSWAAAREHGLIHIEGRDYEVQDGDVCLFRFAAG